MPYDLYQLVRRARQYTAAYATQYCLQELEHHALLEAILISHLAYLINRTEKGDPTNEPSAN